MLNIILIDNISKYNSNMLKFNYLCKKSKNKFNNDKFILLLNNNIKAKLSIRYKRKLGKRKGQS